jgi:hypothetical protein
MTRVVIERRTPEWAAWLQHLRFADPDGALLMAGAGPWELPARWPPASETVTQLPLGNWSIPWGTPEHAAWLAAWRRAGRADEAQAADLGQRTLVEASRWPDATGEEGP